MRSMSDISEDEPFGLGGRLKGGGSGGFDDGELDAEVNIMEVLVLNTRWLLGAYTGKLDGEDDEVSGEHPTPALVAVSSNGPPPPEQYGVLAVRKRTFRPTNAFAIRVIEDEKVQLDMPLVIAVQACEPTPHPFTRDTADFIPGPQKQYRVKLPI